jgi:dGTP triphosphohydrolase
MAKDNLLHYLKAYIDTPSLIPKRFSEKCHDIYKFLSKEEIKIITTRNYVSGMTDSYAIEKHKGLYISSEKATNL